MPRKAPGAESQISTALGSLEPKNEKKPEPSAQAPKAKAVAEPKAPAKEKKQLSTEQRRLTLPSSEFTDRLVQEVEKVNTVARRDIVNLPSVFATFVKECDRELIQLFEKKYGKIEEN